VGADPGVDRRHREEIERLVHLGNRAAVILGNGAHAFADDALADDGIVVQQFVHERWWNYRGDNGIVFGFEGRQRPPGG